jgi:hypothetical protein
MSVSCECCVCHAEVSATGRSLVQRSPTECDVRLSTHPITTESANRVTVNDEIMQNAINYLPTAFPWGGGGMLPATYISCFHVQYNKTLSVKPPATAMHVY